jgi:Outer membrane lipoprotein-sorting protein
VARHGFSFYRQTASVVCLLFALGAVGAVALAPTPLGAQSRLNRPAPRYIQLTPPDQKAGAEILREMRAAGPDGDYYFEFELLVLPRRGEERSIPGRLWGSRNREGPVSRMSLLVGTAGAGGVAGASGAGGAVETRILVQGGPRPAAWRWPAADGSTAISVDAAALFEPLAGTDLSAFDLQMPFLYWPDFVYEGKTRLKDSPADTFLLYPPASLAARRPDLAAMRVYLDPQYHALVRAEQIGENERVLKSMSVVELKKVGEQWIVKAVELRDEKTRNKTRFVVRAAALGRDFAGGIFEPGGLAGGLAAPMGVTRLAE